MTYDFDPELAPWVSKLGRIDYADLDTARATLRQITARQPPYAPLVPVDVTHRTSPGRPEGPPVAVRIYRPGGHPEPSPVLIYLHGGGFVLGDLDTIHSSATRIADQVGVVVVSVDYRLAPEYPFPAGLEDCYAVLEWIAWHAGELGIDPRRIGVGGESSGGGLAAAVTLLARDRGGPHLCFQCLLSPELDDRLDTISARFFIDTPKFDRANALASWTYYLGKLGEPGSSGISEHAAPGRATDLTGLPPAFVSACEFDPLRDEDIAYAHRLIQAGVRTELRYYPGTFHASFTITDAAVSKKMITDQIDALRRGLRAIEMGGENR
ncbi:MAG: alpha/beta hydrolase [Actinomycetota bacterium]|nr:alpha/beta hydrolase [Actinomycetota bacterium]